MKIFYVLSILVGLCCAGSTQAQTHTLAPYLTTNRPGVYLLPFVWTGVQKITLQTGYYKYGGRGAMTVSEEDPLRIDRLTIRSTPSEFFRREIDDSTATNMMRNSGGSYKASLPSNTELAKVHDVSTFTNVLKLDFPGGFTSYPADFKGYVDDTQVFHFATLGSNNTIEAMEVVVHQSTPDANIQGIMVKRGILYPTKKP